jgi:hypothetical protein
LLDGELGHDLADIPVVMHDVLDLESSAEQILAVLGGARTDLRMVDLVGPICHSQSGDELIEKCRYPVREPLTGRVRSCPRRNAFAGAFDDGVAIRNDEGVQHRDSLRGGNGRGNRLGNVEAAGGRPLRRPHRAPATAADHRGRGAPRPRCDPKDKGPRGVIHEALSSSGDRI